MLFDRRGSQTIEYVVILAAGAALAMILHSAVDSKEIKGALLQKIEQAISFDESTTKEKDSNEDSPGLIASATDYIKNGWNSLTGLFSDSKDNPNIEQTLNLDVIGNGGFGGPRGGGPRGAGGHIDNGGGYGYRGDGGNGSAKSGGKGGSKSSISKETAQLAEKHGIKLNGFRLKVRTTRNEKGKVEKWVKTNKGEEKKLRNGHLAGKKHPETGVPFTKNGFPKFDKWSKGDIRLPKDNYLKSDEQQFKFASRRLWDKIKNNEKAKSKFTKNQLEALKNGEERIPGLTWHHHQQQGKMQLVESNVHRGTGHTGGRDIWGGGKEFRK